MRGAAPRQREFLFPLRGKSDGFSGARAGTCICIRTRVYTSSCACTRPRAYTCTCTCTKTCTCTGTKSRACAAGCAIVSGAGRFADCARL